MFPFKLMLFTTSKQVALYNSSAEKVRIIYDFHAHVMEETLFYSKLMTQSINPNSPEERTWEAIKKYHLILTWGAIVGLWSLWLCPSTKKLQWRALQVIWKEQFGTEKKSQGEIWTKNHQTLYCQKCADTSLKSHWPTLKLLLPDILIEFAINWSLLYENAFKWKLKVYTMS